MGNSPRLSPKKMRDFVEPASIKHRDAVLKNGALLTRMEEDIEAYLESCSISPFH